MTGSDPGDPSTFTDPVCRVGLVVKLLQAGRVAPIVGATRPRSRS